MIPDWISAVGGLAGFAALIISLVSQSHSRKLPPPELGNLLLELHKAFDDIIGTDGKPREWFETSERRHQRLSLAYCAPLINDDILNKHVASARYAYFECEELAADPARQVPRAEQGRSDLTRAVNRMTHLIRERKVANY